MTVSKNSLLVLTVMATMLAGCANSRFGNNGGGEPPQVVMPGPASSGGVSQSELPPPDNFPSAPNNSVSSSVPQSQTDVASLQPPSNASDLTPGAIAGVWKASVGGLNCQIATPQTKYGQGYRAGPLHCPEAFSKVASWAVSGKQLNFYDGSGSPVATLYSASPSRFEGNTVNGQSVILSR
ncbi:AprI/Inh family metalloprotease inhibitor [Bartonella apihabitans]|uniref:AprI/Inh family metalloprotease inhibitor n=1 Tax=uncultured Bartonella sp. TaxID=104108 RepID=UPI0025FCC283|nr:AprI/Inh family metalloprotease inhibitor [Bartonella apihabitans]WLT08517.1 AprI/Inh family metalloprotease inhibitor [Bartonella apihabitans]